MIRFESGTQCLRDGGRHLSLVQLFLFGGFANRRNRRSNRGDPYLAGARYFISMVLPLSFGCRPAPMIGGDD